MLNIAFIDPDQSIQYMESAMRGEFRQILLAMKSEHTGQLQSILESEIDAFRSPDDNDVASMQEAVTLETRHIERNTLRLNQINKSLAQIESDEYGYCIKCGDEIGVDRLRAQPTADHCFACKTIAERIGSLQRLAQP